MAAAAALVEQTKWLKWFNVARFGLQIEIRAPKMRRNMLKSCCMEFMNEKQRSEEGVEQQEGK